MSETHHAVGQGSTALSRPPPRMKLTQRARNLFINRAARYAPAGDEPLPDLASLNRVLLVYVNFRLGNAVAATGAFTALIRSMPNATIDILGGAPAKAVFGGYPVRRILTMNRHTWWHLLHYVRFRRALRKHDYDAAIHVSTSTASIGAWAARMSRAPIRIGCKRPSGNIYFTSTVNAPPLTGHKVERLAAYARSIGAAESLGRRMIVTADERVRAEAVLAGTRGPHVAVFLSGRARKGKAWSRTFFAALVERLRAASMHPVVVLGPEERSAAREIKAELGAATYIEQQPLRLVAAVLSLCDAVVTPDSGPMHLAIASATPTVALFRNDDAWKWGPQDGEGLVVLDPHGKDDAAAFEAIESVLRTHSDVASGAVGSAILPEL